MITVQFVVTVVILSATVVTVICFSTTTVVIQQFVVTMVDLAVTVITVVAFRKYCTECSTVCRYILIRQPL